MQTVTKDVTYGVSVSLNGRQLVFAEDMRPFVMDDRTFLPLRAIGDALGLEVDYNAATHTAVLEEKWYVMSKQIQASPDLPEHLDFGGYLFNFLAPENYRDIFASQETGDQVNDAIYRRNISVEEKYNIQIKMLSGSDEATMLRRSVMAGDDIYDAALLRGFSAPSSIIQGILYNTATLPYINLDQPWWDDAVDSLAIAGKNYVLAGDLLTSDKEATNAIVFNKQLIKELGLENPYNLVKEGRWTMDTFNDNIIQAARDLNGDGRMTAFDDRFGFVCDNSALHSLLVAGGGTIAAKGADDLPFMDLISPHNMNVIYKAMDIMYSRNHVLNIHAGLTITDMQRAYDSAFEQQRALFMAAPMREVERFINMEPDFGIIPMPKFDEAQERYYSSVSPFSGGLLAVPLTSRPERTGIILEALAAESRNILLPAYYDKLLSRKFIYDEESSEMLDIIFDSKVYDIGAVYNFGEAYIDFTFLASSRNRNVASFYERNQGRMERDINRFVILFEEIG
jgi:hypothetical protein